MTPPLELAAAVASAVMGGLFLAFSLLVMPALEDAEPMRAINRTALRFPFMLAFFGTPVVCIAAAIVGTAPDWAAAATYLIGVFGATVVGNVPLNNRLAANTIEWPEYRRRWTAWNNVRALAGLAAAVLFLI